MIGIDIEHVSRFGEEKLLKKFALESEIAYIQKYKDKQERMASLWAVKEAVFKALGLSSGEISYKEIELCHKTNGMPYVVFHGKTKEYFDSLNLQIEVSISHCHDIAVAVANIK